MLQDLQTSYRLFHASILTEVGVQKESQIPAAEELLGERGVAVPTLCWWKGVTWIRKAKIKTIRWHFQKP